MTMRYPRTPRPPYAETRVALTDTAAAPLALAYEGEVPTPDDVVWDVRDGAATIVVPPAALWPRVLRTAMAGIGWMMLGAVFALTVPFSRRPGELLAAIVIAVLCAWGALRALGRLPALVERGGRPTVIRASPTGLWVRGSEREEWIERADIREVSAALAGATAGGRFRAWLVVGRTDGMSRAFLLQGRRADFAVWLQDTVRSALEGAASPPPEAAECS